VKFCAVLLAVAAAQQAAAGRLIVPNNPDLKITTRRTIDLPNSTVETEIIYLKGARQRREWIAEFALSIPSLRVRRHASITQCDERRQMLLNEESQTYVDSPIEDMAEHVRLARLRARRHPQPEANGPEVKIVFDSVDTGERRQMGRYVARHVITTTRTEPAPGASTRASKVVQDGWYVDVPHAGCEDSGDRSTFTTFILASGPGKPLDHIVVEQRGTARRGYAIEETSRSKSESGTLGTSRIELVEFSEAPLDAALFDLPAGYRPALPLPWGGYDITKQDTVLNRVEVYCEAFATFISRVFR